MLGKNTDFKKQEEDNREGPLKKYVCSEGSAKIQQNKLGVKGNAHTNVCSKK